MNNFKTQHEFIDLSNQEPSFGGGESVVYLHPNHSDRLIKVIRPGRRLNVPWYKRYRRDYRHLYILRFLSEYLSYQIRSTAKHSIVAIFHGLVETDMGIGMVFERVRDFDDKTSISLVDYVKKHGFSSRLRKKIDALFQEIDDKYLILGDCSADNILVSVSENGDEDLIIIDGVGEKNLIAFKGSSRVMHSFVVNRYETRLVKELNEIVKLEKNE